MLEIDFLPVEAATGLGSKSGDAIAIRFSLPTRAEPIVVIVDGGYTAVGRNLIRHVREHYGTDHVDLVVCTHPDQDHLNGLIPVIEELEVDELMLHLPWNHRANSDEYSNIEKIQELYAVAIANDVIVTEPFAEVERFEGAFRILGPTAEYYEELLTEDLGEERARKALSTIYASATEDTTLREALSHDPLDDNDTTSARNNTSVVALLDAADEFHLLTGDAGISALQHAADKFESLYGSLDDAYFEFFQVPHHGSRRNLGPAILDRLFPNGGVGTTAFISSGAVDEKHPGAAVIDELRARGFSTFATESKPLLHKHDAPERPTYYPASERE